MSSTIGTVLLEFGKSIVLAIIKVLIGALAFSIELVGNLLLIISTELKKAINKH